MLINNYKKKSQRVLNEQICTDTNYCVGVFGRFECLCFNNSVVSSMRLTDRQTDDGHVLVLRSLTRYVFILEQKASLHNKILSLLARISR